MGSNALEQLLAQYDEHVTGLAAELQEFIVKHLPGAQEEVDIPAKLLAYNYGPGYKHVICAIQFSKKGVKLSFNRGAELPDPQHLLTGTGKVHRYVEIKSPADLKSPALTQLMKDALTAYHKRTKN